MVMGFYADSQIYDPDLVPALVNTIHTLICSNPEAAANASAPGRQRNCCQAIIAATVRNEDTLDLFVSICGTYLSP